MVKPMINEQTKIVDFDDKDIAGEVEMPNFARKYAGKPTKIESYEIIEGSYDGKPSYYLRVYTEILATEKIKDKDSGLEQTIEIRASRNFGLIKIDDKFAWSNKGYLAQFLKKHRIKTILELKGLKVMSVTQESKKDKEKEYLSFI